MLLGTIRKYQLRYADNDVLPPVLIAGDFNSTPTSGM
jgi:endonuclease/exonuclease/phosphatase (EEP) superfamily protein YafD